MGIDEIKGKIKMKGQKGGREDGAKKEGWKTEKGGLGKGRSRREEERVGRIRRRKGRGREGWRRRKRGRGSEGSVRKVNIGGGKGEIGEGSEDREKVGEEGERGKGVEVQWC